LRPSRFNTLSKRRSNARRLMATVSGFFGI
jgi:hypothetical protein